MALPVIFAWSGGKDSAMALRCLLCDPAFEVAALLTTVTEGYERVSMHGVRRELVRQQAASIGVPLQEVRIPSQCPNSVYESRMAEAVLRYRDRGILHMGSSENFRP
jgi:diphthamide synthase (EF-2-diphthine--ammonia ligase)